MPESILLFFITPSVPVCVGKQDVNGTNGSSPVGLEVLNMARPGSRDTSSDNPDQLNC